MARARALDAMIDSHLIAAERITGAAPDPERMFVVARVARTSVASRIGVSPGWRVYLPDEDPGAGMLDPALAADATERRYQFFPSGGGEPIGARTSGVDLGMQLLRSADNVVACFDPARPSADAMLDLWYQARWPALEHVALEAITGQKDVSALGDTAALAEFLGAEGAQRLAHPALVLLGAAQYEQGRRAEGRHWTGMYRERYADFGEHVFSAIADLYEGLGALEAGHPQDALEHFERAARQGWLARAVARYQELARTPLDLTPLVGTAPGALTLGQRATDGVPVTLAEAVAALAPGALLTVCALGPTRGNRDYNGVVYRFTRFARHIPERFRTLLVAAAHTERDPAHPEYFHGEDTALAAGVDLQLLVDERAEVHRVLRPGTFPTCYVFDGTGTCVHQGALTACDAWDALARAEQNQG